MTTRALAGRMPAEATPPLDLHMAVWDSVAMGDWLLPTPGWLASPPGCPRPEPLPVLGPSCCPCLFWWTVDWDWGEVLSGLVVCQP